MPPKPKYTKEEIIAAALELVSEKGMTALTARDLGTRLGTSARPIFTAFRSMDEVADGVRAAAMERFASYAHKTGADMPVFKQVGMQMILFAKEEPRLYQLVFMSRNSDVKSFADIYAHLGSVADECMDTIQKDYGVCPARTRKRCLSTHGFTPTALQHFAPRECAILRRKKYPGC